MISAERVFESLIGDYEPIQNNKGFRKSKKGDNSRVVVFLMMEKEDLKHISFKRSSR